MLDESESTVNELLRSYSEEELNYISVIIKILCTVSGACRAAVHSSAAGDTPSCSLSLSFFLPSTVLFYPCSSRCSLLIVQSSSSTRSAVLD